MAYLLKILEDSDCYEIGNGIYEKFLDEYNIRKERYNDERLSKEYIKNMLFHEEYISRFPFFIEMHCSYIFINNIYEIGNNLFGLPHGECEYRDIMSNHCIDDLFLEFKIIVKNKTFHIPNGSCYSHSHVGDWTIRFLTNSGYDEGFNRIYFKTKEMLDLFLIRIILYQNSNYHMLD